jgi:hypothetical protein
MKRVVVGELVLLLLRFEKFKSYATIRQLPDRYFMSNLRMGILKGSMRLGIVIENKLHRLLWGCGAASTEKPSKDGVFFFPSSWGGGFFTPSPIFNTENF